MQAKETHLLKLLKTATQFAIPIYQRTYSWGKRGRFPFFQAPDL